MWFPWIWKVNTEKGVTPGRTFAIRVFGYVFVAVFHWERADG